MGVSVRNSFGNKCIGKIVYCTLWTFLGGIRKGKVFLKMVVHMWSFDPISHVTLFNEHEGGHLLKCLVCACVGIFCSCLNIPLKVTSPRIVPDLVADDDITPNHAVTPLLWICIVNVMSLFGFFFWVVFYGELKLLNLKSNIFPLFKSLWECLWHAVMFICSQWSLETVFLLTSGHF